MRKIIGDELSLFANGDDSVLLAGTRLMSPYDGSASNAAKPLATNPAFDVIASASPMADAFTSHSSLAEFAKPQSTATSDRDRIAVNGAMSDVQSGDTTFAVTSPETVTTPGSGFVFINTYNSGVTQAYHDSIVAAEHYLESHFTNTVTVHTTFGLQSIDPSFSAQNTYNPVTVTY